MRLGVLERDGGAERIAIAHEDAELELIVQPGARGEYRLELPRRQALSPGPVNLLAGDADRGAASVVADGQPFVVGQQRLVGPEQPAHRRGMVNRGVEIGEVADGRGKRVFRQRLGHEAAFEGGLVLRSLEQPVEHGVAKRTPGGGPELHQPVELRAGAGGHRGASRLVEPEGDGAEKAQVQHLIPDRDAAAKRLSGPSPAKHGERQILKRKAALRTVRRRHPARLSRVALVASTVIGCRPRLAKRRSGPGSDRNVFFRPRQQLAYSRCRGGAPFECVAGGSDHAPALEHEGHGVLDVCGD